MDWIHLAQDRDQWQVLVKTVNLQLGDYYLLKKDSASWSWLVRGLGVKKFLIWHQAGGVKEHSEPNL
jgi:hypothetical protein